MSSAQSPSGFQLVTQFKEGTRGIRIHFAVIEGAVLWRSVGHR